MKLLRLHEYATQVYGKGVTRVFPRSFPAGFSSMVFSPRSFSSRSYHPQVFPPVGLFHPGLFHPGPFLPRFFPPQVFSIPVFSTPVFSTQVISIRPRYPKPRVSSFRGHISSSCSERSERVCILNTKRLITSNKLLKNNSCQKLSLAIKVEKKLLIFGASAARQ